MCRSKNWPKKTPHTKTEATLKGNLGYLVNKFPRNLSMAQKYSKTDDRINQQQVPEKKCLKEQKEIKKDLQGELREADLQLNSLIKRANDRPPVRDLESPGPGAWVRVPAVLCQGPFTPQRAPGTPPLWRVNLD